MSPYIVFELGSIENVRGRAFLYIKDQEDQSLKFYTLVDIDGIKLKEAIYKEILDGKLISMDVFEPFFVSTTKLENDFSYEEIKNFAQKESRDLIPLEISHLEKETISEAIIEQGIARYTTIYRENIFLRLLHQLGNEIFHKNRRMKNYLLYVSLFRLTEAICLMGKARRKDETIEIDYYEARMNSMAEELPFLDIKKIICALKLGNGIQWKEIADYIDAFYLSLKSISPFYLGDIIFGVSQENKEWLKQELPGMYKEYFSALFEQNYEVAKEIKQLIDSYKSNQYSKGCC